jgi:molybdate transport system substrate-binding protein
MTHETGTPAIGVLSSMATAKLLGDLAARLQESMPLSISLESIGGVDAARRVRDGEAFDVVVLAAGVIDELIAEGHVVAGTRKDLVRSAIAIAVRTGARLPDIGSAAGVKRAVLAAGSVGYSTGPSGTHLQRLFAQWGIADEVKSRITVAPPGVPVAALLARGDIELGFQQLSEFAAVEGIEVVGMLPPDIQMVTTFSGGIARTSNRPNDAGAVLEFMAAPATADLKRRHGMEPA